MKKLILLVLIVNILQSCGTQQAKQSSGNEVKDGWFSLFNGKNLDNWKFNDKEGTFKVEDGMIVVNGERSHLFYDGPVQNHDFTNFELKADIMTTPNSNSGVYFHTEFQPEGWPDKGYEVQVNNSHGDWRRTGGLYGIADLKEVPTKDNEWFNMHIIVTGKHIVVKLNDKTVVDYTEPENVNYEDFPGRKITHGTFCLQGHDPDSKVYYKNIMVKSLP
jgi:hypothetical protein